MKVWVNGLKLWPDLESKVRFGCILTLRLSTKARNLESNTNALSVIHDCNSHL